MQIKLRQVGNSIGATFPKEVLDKFGLKVGDELNIIVTASGIELTPFDPNFSETISAYKEGAAKYRNAMKELADGRTKMAQ